MGMGDPLQTGGLERLAAQIDRYPLAIRPQVLAGARFAFTAWTTPTLSPDDLLSLEDLLWLSGLVTLLASGTKANDRGPRLQIEVPGADRNAFIWWIGPP